MSELDQVEIAEATAAEDDDAVPSTEIEDQGEQSAEEQQEETPEDPTVILTRNTQKRFDELTQKIKEQEQIIQRRNVEFEDPGAPNPDDFDDELEYAAAKGAYLGEKAAIQRINESLAAQEQQQASLVLQNKVSGYTRRVAEVKEEIPDFEQVVGSSLLVTQDAYGNVTEAANLIMENEHGPEIAVHIAKNPELAMQLNNSTPGQVGMIIERISQGLSVKPAKINDIPEPVGSEDTGAGLAATDDGLQHIAGATFE